MKYFTPICLAEKHFHNRTVTVGNAVTKKELSAALSELFDGGRPCSGVPWDEDQDQSAKYVIQTPISGRSSKDCHVLLGNDADPNTVSCPECLKLCRSTSASIPEVKTEELGECKSVDENGDFPKPIINHVDDIEESIPNIENDQDDYFSGHDDSSNDPNYFEGRDAITFERGL